MHDYCSDLENDELPRKTKSAAKRAARGRPLPSLSRLTSPDEKQDNCHKSENGVSRSVHKDENGRRGRGERQSRCACLPHFKAAAAPLLVGCRFTQTWIDGLARIDDGIRAGAGETAIERRRQTSTRPMTLAPPPFTAVHQPASQQTPWRPRPAQPAARPRWRLRSSRIAAAAPGLNSRQRRPRPVLGWWAGAPAAGTLAKSLAGWRPGPRPCPRTCIFSRSDRRRPKTLARFPSTRRASPVPMSSGRKVLPRRPRGGWRARGPRWPRVLHRGLLRLIAAYCCCS